MEEAERSAEYYKYRENQRKAWQELKDVEDEQVDDTEELPKRKPVDYDTVTNINLYMKNVFSIPCFNVRT